MIVSHRHRFVFIKTRKTAGTSLEIALSALLGPDDIATPVSPQDERLRAQSGLSGGRNFRKGLLDLGPADFSGLGGRVKNLLSGVRPAFEDWPAAYYNHMPAAEVRERIGRGRWEAYFKFAVERNPWDKAVSRYFWLQPGARGAGRRGFRQFVLAGGAYPASDYDLYCIDGVPAMDLVIRYESLDAGLGEVSKRLGLSENLHDAMREIGAKSGLRDGPGYREFYDDETRRTVAVQFAREIELFGYQF